MTVHHVVGVQHLPSGSLGLQMLVDDSVAEPDIVASEEIMEATIIEPTHLIQTDR